MINIFQLAGVIALAVAGGWLGRWLASRPRRVWLGAFLALMLPLILIAIARKQPQWEFHAPWSWLMAERGEFALLAFLIPALLGIPAARLPLPRQRLLVQTLGGLCVCSYSVLPFLMPPLHRPSLEKLHTRFDRHGVCIQGTRYTCGPAASVTALRQLGIAADEGALALRAHSSLYTGTPPDTLRAAIDELYGAEGASTEFRYCRSLDELQPPAVAALKHSVLNDHYVAVIKIGADDVILGDPLHGLVIMSRAAFLKRWRNCAILFRRKSG
ncbi:MAG: Peptidase family [Verrucomicrobiota bacterium]